MSRKDPKVSYLKTLGCVAYFHFPKQLRDKFDVPGKRGLFIGYSNDGRAYIIYDIVKNREIEEGSVKFAETIVGGKFLINKNEN